MSRATEGRFVDPRSPRGYYVDRSSFAGRAAASRGFREHSPRDVARFALGSLEAYLRRGSDERRAAFERAARFLVGSLEVVPSSFGGWAMPSAPRRYEDLLTSGWFAAGTQGECLSVVVRAWLLLGLDGAERASRTAFAAFTAPVSDGGFLREVGDATGEAGVDSLIFFEEHPIEDRPVLDLSGHCRALLGVYDYWRATADTAAESLWERAVRGLAFVLDRYDLGYWTRDDLDDSFGSPNVSSLAAMREHALHLCILSGLSGERAFRDSGRRLMAYERAPLGRIRALAGRTAFSMSGAGT